MEEPKLNELKPVQKKEPVPDVEQQEFDEQKQLDPDICANCGAAPEPGHLVPLCAACRNKLSKYPVPAYITISLIAVLALTAFAAVTKFPQALKAGIAFAKGEKAEKAGQYEAAFNYYFEAMDTYRDSTQLLARIALSGYKAGDYDAAALYINKIAGREVSKTLAAEINTAIAGIEAYDAQQEAKAKVKIKKPAAKKNKGGAR
jgi:tetratricopeptide (TPR) repeat protein